jgi:hypothetical protein
MHSPAEQYPFVPLFGGVKFAQLTTVTVVQGPSVPAELHSSFAGTIALVQMTQVVTPEPQAFPGQPMVGPGTKHFFVVPPPVSAPRSSALDSFVSSTPKAASGLAVCTPFDVAIKP